MSFTLVFISFLTYLVEVYLMVREPRVASDESRQDSAHSFAEHCSIRLPRSLATRLYGPLSVRRPVTHLGFNEHTHPSEDLQPPHSRSLSPRCKPQGRGLFSLLPLTRSHVAHRFTNLGIGWGASTFGFIAVAIAPSPFLFYKYGWRLRQMSRFAPCLDVGLREQVFEEERLEQERKGKDDGGANEKVANTAGSAKMARDDRV